MSVITIIIPVYNIEKYIKRCVNSVLNQSYSTLEIILVDDGSTDSSGSICDILKKKHSNIRVIHKENEGLGSARNTGLAIASGEYVTFVDGDDCIGLNHIMNLYNNLIQNNADVCYGGHTKIKSGEETEYPNVFAGQSFIGDEIIKNVIPRLCGQSGSLYDNIQMSVCMALYKIDLIKKNNLKFVSERSLISEDLIFNMDYLKYANLVCFSNNIEYKYYFNRESLTHHYLHDRFEKSKLMMLEVAKRVSDWGIYDLCEQRILNTFIISARVSIQAEQKNATKVGKRIAYTNFKKYICDIQLQNALKKYRNENVRIQARIINLLMRKKLYRLLWIIMILRNKFDI